MLNLAVDVGGKNFDGSRYNWKKDVNGVETLRDFFGELKTTLIEVDRDVLAEEIAGGFDAKARIKVDGVWDRKVTDVQPVGTIQHFARLDQAVFMLAMYRKLLEYSRVKTGQYIQSHFVYLNGSYVAGNYNQLFTFLNGPYTRNAKDTDEFRFINITVYARKLETAGQTAGSKKPRRRTQRYRNRARGGGSTRVLRLPNGAYYRTYVYMKRQGGKVAGQGFRFEFISNGNFGIKGFASRTGYGGRTDFKKSKRPYLHPCIIFKPYSEALR